MHVARFNAKSCEILPHGLFMFCMILTWNSHCFPKQHSEFSFCNGSKV